MNELVDKLGKPCEPPANKSLPWVSMQRTCGLRAQDSGGFAARILGSQGKERGPFIYPGWLSTHCRSFRLPWAILFNGFAVAITSKSPPTKSNSKHRSKASRKNRSQQTLARLEQELAAALSNH